MENGNRDGSPSIFIFEGELDLAFSVLMNAFFFFLRRIYEIGGRQFLLFLITRIFELKIFYIYMLDKKQGLIIVKKHFF